MTEQSTIPGLFCFFIVFVSLGARRVELDCAGPPHWRGSPPFSGANADSSIDPAGFKYYLSSWLSANV